jgi:hypothetical protein
MCVAGKASVAAIVAISVAGGVVGIVDSPARQAFVGSLVMPEDLSSAVSLNGPAAKPSHGSIHPTVRNTRPAASASRHRIYSARFSLPWNTPTTHCNDAGGMLIWARIRQNRESSSTTSRRCSPRWRAA